MLDRRGSNLAPGWPSGGKTLVSGQIQYGSAVRATSVETPAAPADDQCHFTTAVRFGRRKTDQVGHLVLTSGWLTFRGTVDLNVAWSEVAHVESSADQVIVSLHGTQRILRFCCCSSDEAHRGSVVAAHLAALAHADAYHHV
jgi:hypothetical protein